MAWTREVPSPSSSGGRTGGIPSKFHPAEGGRHGFFDFGRDNDKFFPDFSASMEAFLEDPGFIRVK